MGKKRFLLFGLFLLVVFLGSQVFSSTTPVVLTVGASPTPHAGILEVVKPMLAAEGIEIKIIEFQDYVQPNLALAEGDLDANFFQHIPYLEQFSKDHRLDLTQIAKVHVEPMGVYSQKVTKIEQLRDKAVVAIPNDPTNCGRALMLLEQANLIELRKGVGVLATELDITKNPKQLQVKALEAAQLPRILPEVDLAVINTNYALDAGLKPKTDALQLEGADSPYVNYLVARPDNQNDPRVQALATALRSQAVKDFIARKYDGAVIPAA